MEERETILDILDELAPGADVEGCTTLVDDRVLDSLTIVALVAELEDAFHTSLIGTEQPVLFEQPENGFYAGHAPNYAKVYTAPGELHNAVRRVRITELCRDGVFGVLTDTP